MFHIRGPHVDYGIHPPHIEQSISTSAGITLICSMKIHGISSFHPKFLTSFGSPGRDYLLGSHSSLIQDHAIRSKNTLGHISDHGRCPLILVFAIGRRRNNNAGKTQFLPVPSIELLDYRMVLDDIRLDTSGSIGTDDGAVQNLVWMYYGRQRFIDVTAI